MQIIHSLKKKDSILMMWNGNLIGVTLRMQNIGLLILVVLQIGFQISLSWMRNLSLVIDYVQLCSMVIKATGKNHYGSVHMTSKRKYNPNKISQLIQSKSMQSHRLWMRYDNDLIDRITDEWLKTHPNEDVATSLLYPHIEGDLIIAIKHRLIDLNQKWHIKLTLELDDGTDAELIFDLPKAHLKDIKLPTAEFKIDRGNGIKTRWKGLDKEVEDAIKPLENEGVACIRTWAYIAVDTPFKSKADYSYFVQEKALRLMLGEMVAA